MQASKSDDEITGTDTRSAAASVPDRVVTIPNILSALRLLGVPVFLWVFLVHHADGWALAILMLSGFSDWLDGKLARILDQSSRLGVLLDPAADRLYMVVVPVAFVLRDILPWWVVALIVARDLLLACVLPILRVRGILALPVHYLGKAATFALMGAFPMLLLGQWDSWMGNAAAPFGYALLCWGTVLYLWTWVLYMIQVVMIVKTVPRLGAQ
ncbi:MAG: CDP-alcohol phosphatidyltransferase family protein [Mycobacteriaceae bacterium]